MKKFKNESGTLKYNDKKYSFVLDKNIVKLFSERGTIDYHNDNITLGKGYKTEETILYGETNDGYFITFFLTEFYYAFNKYIYFSPHYYIKGLANMTKPSQDKFNRLDFTGNLINFIYDSQQGWIPYEDSKHNKVNEILKQNGINNFVLAFNEQSDLVKEYKLNLFGQSVTLRYQIDVKIAGYKIIDSNTNPAAIFSIISMIFDNEQDIMDSLKYIDLFKKFVSFLLQNANIDFDVTYYNSTEYNSNTQIGELYRYQRNEEFYKPTRRNEIIDLRILDNSAINLLEGLSKNEIRIEHLPTNKRDALIIDANRIVKICTAMEFQYQRLNRKTKNIEDIIQKVKDIIVNEHKDESITQTQQDYFLGNISSWSLPLVEQFEHLYSLISNKIKTFIETYNRKTGNLPITYGQEEKKYNDFIDAKQLRQSLQEYITIRNLHVHSNIKKKVDINESNALTHNLLLSTIFANDLTKIGVNEAEINNIVYNYYRII